MNTATRSRIRGRLTLFLLLAVFLAPAVGGWLWFHFGDDFSQRNYGTLYQPARPLTDISFVNESGEAESLSNMRGTWLLAYVGEGACTSACLQQLDKLSRVRLSQSKNVKRIRAAYFSSDGPHFAEVEQIRGAMPNGTLGSLDGDAMDRLVSKLARDGETRGDVMGRIYLIDPIGNLVLSYETDADPSKMRKDLSRLLRVSQIG
jgi:cytochrome oxidase Cu insertion factor (SCO1/SenC/PrrC family)